MATSRPRFAGLSRPDLSFLMLAALFLVLWIAGGASREDAAGQVVVRAASWACILVAVLFGRKPRIEEARAVALIVGAAILLCVAQLVPLPPGVWRALPGRAVFTDALVSPANLWRPWSLVPGATTNALSSLVVPLAVLTLASGMRAQNRHLLPAVVLTVIALALLVGLLQVTGVPIANPMVNGSPGAVDGLIANRNHFALFLAIGLVITPVWGSSGAVAPRVRAPVALGLVLLLILTILASGSRAGMALGAIALILGLAIAGRNIKAALSRYPRWTLPALGIALVALIAIFVLASVFADRAESVHRLIDVKVEDDTRGRALPTVLAIIRTYFPFGSGLGSFDPIFRLHEPFSMLRPTYFNHAHNDFLEIALTAGLPGLLLIAAAIGWWLWRSVAAWRGDAVLPKLGSAILLLILLASVVDYPARTPLIMAITTITAIWLGGPTRAANAAGEAPLPLTRRNL